MSPADSLSALLGAAAEAGARRALEAVGRTGDGEGLVNIKDAPVAYRQLLEAINAGELRSFRVGRATFVRRVDLETWITSAEHAVDCSEPQPDEPDEIGDVIEINHRRRRGGGAR
jgi:hypothetical protein